MRLGYNILFFLFFWLSAPFYFLKMWRRGHWRPGFAQRFGYYSSALKDQLTARPVFWLHAVSVGEVGVCAQLIRALEPHLEGVQILVSTTTSTGMAELERLLPAHVLRIYYPIDFAGSVRRALRAIQPRAVVLVEAELWPNFLWKTTDADIPLYLVNARISERSFRNYNAFKFLFRPIFSHFVGVGCQQTNDAERLIELGFRSGRVHVTGNLKFDAAQPGPRGTVDVSVLLRKIGINEQSLLLVAGSTHAGEEAILGAMLRRLRLRFPNLFLILVPRHVERTKDVMRDLEAQGVKYICRTDLETVPAHPCECLLVNSTGELKYFYEHADVVFVGKSLTAVGGQNPIEPAALGKAIVVGPNMQNFVSATRSFLAGNGLLQVADAAQLESTIAELLADKTRRDQLGARARRVVQENLGATARTVQFLCASATAPPPGANPTS